jgi:hypothetical protein
MLARGVVTRALATTMCLGTLAVMLWRIRHGIDYTDEAFYIAMPVRFALGDRPFVDELNITQTAALLLYPFVRVYTALRGGTTGIFLFVRILYVLFFGLVGGGAYALAALRLPRPTALLIGAACICFLPYGVPGLSYNTLSMGLLAIGLFVAARGMLSPHVSERFYRSPFVWAGFAHGAASFAYPTVTLAALTTALAVFALTSGQRVRATLLYAAGGLGFGVVVSPVLLSAGMAQLRLAVAYTGGESHAADATAAHFSALLDKFLAVQPQLPFAAFAVVLAIVLARRWPLVTGLALPFLPLLARGSRLMAESASLGYVACFGLLAPLLCLGLRDTKAARVLGLGVAVPSIVAGAALTATSGNNVYAAGVGLFPSAIAAAIALAMLVDETAKRWPAAVLRAPTVLSPAVLLWVMLSFITADDGYYRDAQRPAQTAKIGFGPYKGLFTTPQRRASLAAMSADLIAHARTDRALFFYDLPVGYVIVFRRPLAASVWPFALPARMEHDARYFREHAKPGDMVYRDGRLGTTPLDRAVAERCELIGNRETYSLYEVR